MKIRGSVVFIFPHTPEDKKKSKKKVTQLAKISIESVSTLTLIELATDLTYHRLWRFPAGVHSSKWHR